MDGFDATALSNFQLVQFVLAIFSELLRRLSLQEHSNGNARSSTDHADEERGLRSPERCGYKCNVCHDKPCIRPGGVAQTSQML